MRKKHWDAKSIIGLILLITLLGSIVYAGIGCALAPEAASQPGERCRSDYVLMLLQCCLGLAVMFLPNMLQKKWTWPISDAMYILYFLFLYCAIYLGEVRNFFYVVPHWDTWLHTFSGGMLGALGFIVVDRLTRLGRKWVQLSPGFVCLFALCFAVTIGVLWEIYEFTFDGLLGLNMQKFRLEDGTQLVGRAALQDTMKDLIVDVLGAAVVVGLGYLHSLREQKHQKLVNGDDPQNTSCPKL